jgi:hypothetical protein
MRASSARAVEISDVAAAAAVSITREKRLCTSKLRYMPIRLHETLRSRGENCNNVILLHIIVNTPFLMPGEGCSSGLAAVLDDKI